MLNNFVQFSSENNTKNIKKKFLLLDYIGIKSLINSVLLIFWVMILVGTFRYFI